MRRLFVLGWLFLLAGRVAAQDLNAIVDVNSDRIQNVDPKVFESLKKGLRDFLNSRKWTTDNLKPAERIDCNFLLTITEKSGDHTFKANLNIQSSRPVFNSGYNSPMVNYVDRDVTFNYDQSQTLTFDDSRVAGSSDGLTANLTAIFAYYAYVIVGLDYQSFSLRGGDDYFKKAQNVVQNAPEDSKSIKGWKAAEGNRNRYWLIDQILNPRFADMWPYFYNYHRKGLDMMSSKPEEARKVILDGIPTLTAVNNANPTSVLFQFFFNAKSVEFQNVLMQTPVAERKDYIDQLCKMDVPNTAKYRSIK